MIIFSSTIEILRFYNEPCFISG